MKYVRPFISKLLTGQGYVSKEEWQSLLIHEVGWDIKNFRPDDPMNGYESRVDMSYYIAANGKPKA
jgi:hypothetical protein